MSSAVSRDCEAIEWRGARRGERLAGLRVLEGVDEAKVVCDVVVGGRLEEDVGAVTALEGLGEGIGRLAEALGGDDGGSQRGGGIEVLQEGAAEGDDGNGGIDGDASEGGDVLAAVDVGTEMCGGGVGEEDEGEGGDVSLNVLELVDGEGLVPADVDEDLDAAVKLEQRLRGGRGRVGAEQGREVEHGRGGRATRDVEDRWASEQREDEATHGPCSCSDMAARSHRLQIDCSAVPLQHRCRHTWRGCWLLAAGCTASASAGMQTLN